MRKFILMLLMVLVLSACGNPEPLEYSEIEDLPEDEQVDAIVENVDLIEEYEIIIEDNKVAIVYPSDYVSDSRLALDDDDESFPNVAMTLSEHLAMLEFDEVVITAYEPSDSDTQLTRVSAMLTNETIQELDFERWKDHNKEERPQRFYIYHADAYLIRGMVWDNLSDETRDDIGSQRRNSDSEFWGYYGSIVE